ncbi:MAG TPA: hypothetical protein VFX50_12105, partial [Gemmatimonadales bacterium]|nr:hypothetical protein [Gemmatimonadales bacterium]
QLCERQLARGLNSPLVSSMGRLFDAAACALRLRTEAHYEGQAAMELEALAGERPGETLPFPLVAGDAKSGEPEWLMDPVPLLLALLEGVARGHDRAVLAAGFHDAVARTAAELAARAAAGAGTRTVVLGGGTFQNVRLLTQVGRLLDERGLRVLRPLRLSPNDGAIAYGQLAVAAARLSSDIA